MLDMRANMEIRINDFQRKNELVLAQRTTNEGLQAFMLFSADVKFNVEDNNHYLCLDLVAMFSENVIDKRYDPIHVAAIKLNDRNKSVKEILDSVLKEYKDSDTEDVWKKAKIDYKSSDLGFNSSDDENKKYIQTYILSSIDEFFPLRYIELCVYNIDGRNLIQILLDLNTSDFNKSPIIRYTSPNSILKLDNRSITFYDENGFVMDKIEWLRRILYNNNYLCPFTVDGYSGSCRPWQRSIWNDEFAIGNSCKFEKEIKDIYEKSVSTRYQSFQQDKNRTLNIFKFKFKNMDITACDINPDDYISTSTDRFVFRVLAIGESYRHDWNLIFEFDDFSYKIINLSTGAALGLQKFISLEHQTINIPSKFTIETPPLTVIMGYIDNMV